MPGCLYHNGSDVRLARIQASSALFEKRWKKRDDARKRRGSHVWEVLIMRMFSMLIGSLVLVIGLLLAGNYVVGGEVAAEESAVQQSSGYYQVPYIAIGQNNCGAQTIDEVCCDKAAYIPVSQVDSACLTSTAQIVRVARSHTSPGDCCGCSRDFCVQISSSTPVVLALPSGACTLRVLDCHNSCSDCLDALSTTAEVKQGN